MICNSWSVCNNRQYRLGNVTIQMKKDLQMKKQEDAEFYDRREEYDLKRRGGEVKETSSIKISSL